ncbi:MAG: amidohydrolase family protein [Kiritimatiellae bacterium]|nr:amidohydrolase family protein [Kiritimatiellia bacterium]
MLNVDSHHHFWQYNAAEYGWIGDTMAGLRRDFGPQDLEREIRAAGLDAVVSVQARQSLAETEWLCGLAARHAFIAGVVGWVPLADRDIRARLDALAAHPKLKAVRHVLQDEPDASYMLRPDFNAGVAVLREYGLAYDILIYERHLPQTLEFVDRHPDQVFVLDHAGKPLIRSQTRSPWDARIRELAKRANVYCKVSGMVTEADWAAWNEAQLRPYVDVLLESFGPARLMFGSDWPVCLAACPYARWLETVRGYIGRLSADEQASLLGGTAVKAYGLSG